MSEYVDNRDLSDFDGQVSERLESFKTDGAGIYFCTTDLLKIWFSEDKGCNIAVGEFTVKEGYPIEGLESQVYPAGERRKIMKYFDKPKTKEIHAKTYKRLMAAMLNKPISKLEKDEIARLTGPGNEGRDIPVWVAAIPSVSAAKKDFLKYEFFAEETPLEKIKLKVAEVLED